MHQSFHSVLAAILTVGTQFATSSPMHCPDNPACSTEPRALYLMSNNANNSILAVNVAANGMLSGGTSIGTGGSGGNLISTMTGKPSQPDALSVQDSVVVAGQYLFNVNAGSGTVSMFLINPYDPTNLALVGEPKSSNGNFPTSLAVSLELSTVCVANTGSPAGVACATFNTYQLGEFDDLRMLDVGQSDPPTGPTPGVGDILFDATSSSLVVMVKGNGTEFTGYAAVYPVDVTGTVSSTCSKTTPNGTMALFGATLMPYTKSKIYTSDAGFGAVVLDLNNLTIPLSKTVVPGQIASCWAKISPYGTGFITDVAVNRLIETDLYSGAILSQYYPPNENVGMSDFQIAGTSIWTLSANNGSVPAVVTVFDISGGAGSAQMTQVYEVTGAGPNSMGLVIY